MKKLWKVKMVFFVVASIIVFAAVVMWLWNWLIPDLFHGPVINFLQAIGLMLLTRILFRGFHGIHGKGMYCNRMGNWKERYEKMTPEQRDKMRELWKKRCGGFDFEEEKNN